MRRSSLDRPFTQGMVTDQPAWILAPQLSVFAQDGFTPYGMFRQRQGWEYDGSTADVADNLVAVHRNQFVLADVNRTVTADDDGDLFVHNASSSGTALYSGSVQYLPRCVYRDEVIWCAQDGVTPLRRHAGAAFATDSGASAVQVNLDTAMLTATSGSFGASTTAGAFATIGVPTGVGDPYPHFSLKVLERISSTNLTLEDFLGVIAVPVNFAITGTGTVYPCVSVYSAGTGTFDTANDRFTGTGTTFTGGGWGSVVGGVEGDGLLTFTPGGDTDLAYISSASSSTRLELVTTTRSDANLNYAILRRAPFKDAASHKGGFWGTGVAQYPSRVYVGPPRWNLAVYPGAITPVKPGLDLSSSNANDFLMDFVDVPSSFDGDDNIAILSSPNPLLVLKRNAVYGIYGSYPNFSVDMVADGIGCIDIRSAHSYDEGQFWAGEGGIYWYTGGRIVDLTAGKINREWRALTRDFDYGTSDYCTLGVAQGHLVVHITTGGGTTQRTYLCDLRNQSWQSRISNFTPRYMATSRIAGEKEKLLAVSNARQGRVLNFAPALDGSGTAKDDAGDAPRLQAWTPEGIDGSDIDDDTRFIDLAVHANVYDAGAAGSTSMAVSVVSQDALTSQGTGTKTLADIDSDATDRLDRHYYRTVNRRGRRHQVRLAVDTLGTDSNATKVEVAQIDTTFRQARGRS